MSRALVFVSILVFLSLPARFLPAAERLNLLISTVDDLSADSIDAFGCKLPGTSPNVDQLAKAKGKAARTQKVSC